MDTMDFSWGFFKEGGEFPYLDGDLVQGDQEVDIVDNNDLASLSAVFYPFDAHGEKNKLQSFDYQFLDDEGTVIYSGHFEPLNPDGSENHVYPSLALARVTSIPAIPSPSR